MPQSFAEQLRSIPMSPNLGQSLERAHRSARDQSHRLVTLEHLLLALTEDAEAALILQSANVDLARLGTDVSGYLGRLMDDMRAEVGIEPRPDAELLRVLQAAASAAQQSRRKQIDGAIVLAAIVGDGKSPAAGLLKALGMTFEEAIRALQRANTKARLKPLAKASGEAAVSAAAATAMLAPALPDTDPQTAAASNVPITEPATSIPQPLTTQSADEILAAARARIQRRTGATASAEPVIPHEAPTVPPLEPTTPAALEADQDPEIEPVDPIQTKSLTAAIEAAMASSPARKTEARPPEPASAATLAPPAQARAAWAPEPRPQPSSARLPQAVAARAASPPFPARPLQPNEGPRRPPLPPRPVAYAQPQPGIPNRPARAPWPEPGERGHPVRPPVANGSYGEGPAPPQSLERSDHASRPASPARGGVQGEKGLLVEAVPRRMRIGVPAAAEVRIARDKVDGLLLALNGREPHPSPDALLTRALSVRLRAAKGGFWIEPATPETQWLEIGPNRAEDDYIVWRWTVLPRRRGRSRLTLTVSAHTAGRDGIAATTSPPDRVIEVKVRPNQLRRALRLVGWIAAGFAGAALARFGPEYWPLANVVIKKTLGI